MSSSRYGFFFFPPSSPPSWLMVSVAFPVGATPVIPLARPCTSPAPPAHDSSDFNRLAAAPPTSGTNWGFAVVPFTCNGTLIPPLLQLVPPPSACPAIPPKPPAADPAAALTTAEFT